VDQAPVARDRRILAEEVLIVLALSLLPSAVNSLITLFEAPVTRGVAVALYPSVELARQLTSIAFSLAPVALVFHLARRDPEDLRGFGLGTDSLGLDAAWGLAAAAVVSAVGLALYVAAIAANYNRFVIPVPPLGHWWTIPILLTGSLQNAVLEEVIVVGYLIRRLEQLGLASVGALLVSAAFRGSYHLYQGWGSFAGNVALGLFFGWIFLRWRRTWPLITAHFAIDALAGIGYIVFRGDCFFKLCIK
jgi:membrane protease YdiL (CAAX protease family)